MDYLIEGIESLTNIIAFLFSNEFLIFIGIILIIKICYWIGLYNGIAKIENVTYKFANKQIKQNEKIIENQMEIIRLLGGEVEEVEEVPEEDEEDVDKTTYV